MFFADAVKYLASQQMIRRSSWRDGDVLIVPASGGNVFVRSATGGDPRPWWPTIDDLTAADWNWAGGCRSAEPIG